MRVHLGNRASVWSASSVMGPEFGMRELSSVIVLRFQNKRVEFGNRF